MGKSDGSRFLQFGVFDHLDDSGLSLERHYADRLEMAEACDRAGFRAYHIAEHHGTPHGHAPSPNLFLAAVAQRTSRMRLGPLVMLLSLYHPLRAFEEICMLDQISGGRVEFGIGRGAGPIEPGFFGIPPDRAQELYGEALDIILRAMDTDRLSYEGRHFRLDGVPITLAPKQLPHPPLWYGTTKPRTAAWAAENAINIACIGPPPAIRKVTDAYRGRWAEAGEAGRDMPLLGMVRFIVVAGTDAEARAVAAPAYARWFETLHHLPRSQDLAISPMMPATLAEAIEEGHCLVGSVATVRDALMRQARQTGATYALCHIAFGDLPLEVTLGTVEALRTEIMPVFASAEAEGAGV